MELREEDTFVNTSNLFALQIEGSGEPGLINNFSGGTVKGEVTTSELRSGDIRKHITNILFEPITIEVGFGQPKGFYDWLQLSFEQDLATRYGKAYICNSQLESTAELEFRDAYISEVTIPAMDGSSKDSAYIKVKIDPEQILYPRNSRTMIRSGRDSLTKNWIGSNFRLELGNLPCSKVAKIDSFTWKKSVINEDGGSYRDQTKYISKVEVPNIKLTISADDIDPWMDWHRSFVIDGRCSRTDELSGKITFLATDLRTTLGEIELLHVGIISVQSFMEDVGKFEVELYVNNMGYRHGSM